MTRIDHAEVSNQMYANYAAGKETQALKSVVGEEALSDEERRFLKFETNYERKFVNQDPYDNRDIFTSLDIAWELLAAFPPQELKHVSKKQKDTDKPKTLEKFYTRDARKAYGKFGPGCDKMQAKKGH